MYVKKSFQIKGESLVLHNGQTSDPLNPHSKAMKVITGKRKKVDADHEKLAELEYVAGLYINTKGEVIIPSRVIEAAVCVGARKTKEGKLALSGMFIDTDLVLGYDGGPLSVEALTKSTEHRLTVPVRIGQSRVMRTRPIFHGWHGKFTVTLNTEVATVAQLTEWVIQTGNMIGLCDWRPRHGRFEVV